MTTPVAFDDDPRLGCRQPGIDPEVFFPDPGARGNRDRQRAKTICNGCPRRRECLQRAINSGDVDNGILGGRTPTERRAILARQVETRHRPEPPPRADRPFGWHLGHTVDVPMLRRLLKAARHHLATGMPVAATATKFGVHYYRLAEAVAITRWAPDLAAAVVDGWVPWSAAHRYAQQMRRWTEITTRAA